ncbi:MAG: hypothetical protein VX405_07260 [Myxococcota bacterium]|nr:hypothetical protein [Myxococcota bacterium]
MAVSWLRLSLLSLAISTGCIAPPSSPDLGGGDATGTPEDNGKGGDGGFQSCAEDADCPDRYVCDSDKNICVEGAPEPQVECRDDEDCDRGLRCVASRCEPPAEIDGLCGEDSDCDDNMICDEQQCRPGECTPDRGCDDEEECVHGRCRPVDPSDCMEEGCPGDAVCHPDLRRCLDPDPDQCRENGDCRRNQQCVEGRCVDGRAEVCEADEDCDLGLICDPLLHTCRPQVGETCANDEDCGIDERCQAVNRDTRRCVSFPCLDDVQCRARGGVCDEDTNRCIPDDRPGCDTDRDCERNELCNRNARRCEPKAEGTCFSDFDCEEGTRCDRESRECVPENFCRTALDCLAGELCDRFECRPTRAGDRCWNNDGCGDGLVCQRGICRDEDDAGGRPGGGGPGGGPGGGGEAECRSNRDCDRGEVCDDGECRRERDEPRCRDDGDCDGDEVCTEGRCQPDDGGEPPEPEPEPFPNACGENQSCPEGQACYEERCRDRCEEDADCEEGGRCMAIGMQQRICL